MTMLPEGIDQFLQSAQWDGAQVDPIPGDASFRRYFRIRRQDGANAMLMYAPPPQEDPAPFLQVAEYLQHHQMRAPHIIAADAARGWVLLEDFGNDRMRDWLDQNPDGEMPAYQAAVDALVQLHQQPAGPFPPYDMDAYRREYLLFTQWYCPAMGLDVDEAGFALAWDQILIPIMQRQSPGVTVLRDYHAENIMLLGDPRGGAEQGLIDFQDALVGHRAYDLVSLLQDARRDVSPALERAMLDHYFSKMDALARSNAGPNGATAQLDRSEFEGDYACLGAQRNAKIVGIFTRLYRRDGKARYLDLIPRVWAAMERDLRHPALAPVAQWFDQNIPQHIRQDLGGTLE